MRKVDFEQGSEDWLNWRKGLLTATDAAMLLGASPYVTPYKGWQRKTGQAPEQVVNSAMQRGQRDEPIARSIFNREYGINMTPCCIESEKYNFLGASLDGMSECETSILEIKSQRPVNFVPEFHMFQIQHQMLCSDGKVKQTYYVSHWEGENITFTVLPDEEWMKNYIPKAQEFWKSVLLLEPPALSCKDYKDMTGAVNWDGYASEYKNLCAQIKVLEELKDSYKKELINLCGDDSCSGNGIKVLKKMVKGRVDYEKIPELSNVDFDKYRKPASFSWTIMLEQKKEN